MTSCTFYEYSLHGALRSLSVRVKRGVGVRVMGGVCLDVRVKGGVLV